MRRLSTPVRSRLALAACALATIALGLASRQFPAALPALIATYSGDALWAATVFWLVAFLRPRARTATVAAAALLVSALVELSQLYHAPWLDDLRATDSVALVLGQGFLWTDLLCYAAGVALATVADRWLVPR